MSLSGKASKKRQTGTVSNDMHVYDLMSVRNRPDDICGDPNGSVQAQDKNAPKMLKHAEATEGFNRRSLPG